MIVVWVSGLGNSESLLLKDQSFLQQCIDQKMFLEVVRFPNYIKKYGFTMRNSIKPLIYEGKLIQRLRNKDMSYLLNKCFW